MLFLGTAVCPVPEVILHILMGQEDAYVWTGIPGARRCLLSTAFPISPSEDEHELIQRPEPTAARLPPRIRRKTFQLVGGWGLVSDL